MTRVTVLILIHQLIFQGMFFAKNIALKKRLGLKIKGSSIESTLLIIFFVLFILYAFVLSFSATSSNTSFVIGIVILVLNLVVVVSSLLGLKESWRVGVLEDQKTELITNGIYGFTRNPYFVSYLLLLVAYSILLQSIAMAILTAVGFVCIHALIVREESYLRTVHGEVYEQYLRTVPRYLIF